MNILHKLVDSGIDRSVQAFLEGSVGAVAGRKGAVDTFERREEGSSDDAHHAFHLLRFLFFRSKRLSVCSVSLHITTGIGAESTTRIHLVKLNESGE